MATEEIREMSARMLSDERKEAHQRKESTPRKVTNDIKALVGKLGSDDPTFIPVIDDDFGLYGWCSDGVSDKVSKDGGTPVYGWTIWEWPGKILTAEFHCVWKDQDDRLHDITPKPGRERRILFSPDPTYPPEFDFDERPLNVRTRLYQAADMSELVSAQMAKLKGGQLAYEVRRAKKAGKDLEAWLESKLPTDPLPEAIDKWLACCDEFDRHFDTLGTSGEVQVDDTLLELAKRRLTLQKKVEQLSGA